MDGVLKLAIVDIASNSLHETTSLIQARSAEVDVQSVIADLSKEDEVQRVFAEIQEHFRRLNVAVNCAGIVGALRPIEQLSSADLDRVLDINLRSVWAVREGADRAVHEAGGAGCEVGKTSPVYIAY